VVVDVQVVQESDDDTAQLQVSQVTRQDSGLYEARVHNELGFETSAFSVYVLGKLANTRSPEAPAAAGIHLHVSPRPASACVCLYTAGTWARPPIRVSAVAQR